MENSYQARNHFSKKLFPIVFFLLFLFVAATAQQKVSIINGTPVPVGNYEWMAGLSSTNSTSTQFAGGSLIAPQWVLTSAQQVSGLSPSNLYVFFKAYHLSNPVAGYIITGVTSINIHPNYNSLNLDHDIALVELSNSVSSITPINLPSQDDSSLLYIGKSHQVMGWGKTQSVNHSDTLNEGTVPIIDFQLCNGPSSYNGNLTSNMMCAGDMAGGQPDACAGDGGGPLVTDTNSILYQTGIASWGSNPCGQANLPWVYTRVPNYINWINSVTGSTSYINNNNFQNNLLIIHQAGDENILIKGFPALTNISGVEFYNVTGQLVAKSNMNYNYVNGLSLPVNTLSEGMYFIKIYTNEKVYSGKFIR